MTDLQELMALLEKTNLDGTKLERNGSDIFTADGDLLMDVYYNAAHSLDGSDMAAAILASLNFLRSPAFAEMARDAERYREIERRFIRQKTSECELFLSTLRLDGSPMDQLGDLIDAAASGGGCGACGDGCTSRGSCRVADESPPTMPSSEATPGSCGEAPDGTWLWCKLMDWCNARRVAPSNYGDLFAIAGEAHKLNAAQRHGRGEKGNE